MSSQRVFPVEMGPLPGSPTMGGTSHETHTSFLDTLSGRNYPKDSHAVLVWWIIISIVTFFIMLIVNIFFVYVPISRMEEKFDATAQKLDEVGVIVKDAADGVDKVIKDVEELGKIAVAEFDKVKAGICAWLRNEGIDFPYCSEKGTSEVLASQNSITGFRSRSLRNGLGTSKCRF